MDDKLLKSIADYINNRTSVKPGIPSFRTTVKPGNPAVIEEENEPTLLVDKYGEALEKYKNGGKK
jgi:hypothetical protein